MQRRSGQDLSINVGALRLKISISLPIGSEYLIAKNAE